MHGICESLPAYTCVARGRLAHLEEDIPEGRPTAEHVEILLVILEASEAGNRVDELHVRQVALTLKIVEEGGILVTEVLQERHRAYKFDYGCRRSSLPFQRKRGCESKTTPGSNYLTQTHGVNTHSLHDKNTLAWEQSLRAPRTAGYENECISTAVSRAVSTVIDRKLYQLPVRYTTYPLSYQSAAD